MGEMPEGRDNPFDDNEFVLESPSSLKSPDDAPNSPGTPHSANTPDFSISSDAWEHAPGTVDAETLVNRRASPRKRAVQLGLAALCALIVIGLFRSTASFLPRPEATATPAASDASQQWIAIISNVSYGSVTIDGKRLTGKPPFAFHPKPDGETVTYSAPPFGTHTCQVSLDDNGNVLSGDTVANSLNNNCLFGSGSDIPIPHNGQTILVSNYVEFDFSADDLPADLKASALAFVQQTVTPTSRTATVPAGQYYATGRDSQGMIQSRVASAPLTAKVTLALPTPQQLMAGPNTFCQEIICANGGALPFDGPAPEGNYWSIMAPLDLSWQFSTADGLVVGNQDDGQPVGGELLNLSLDGSGNWQLVQSPYSFLNNSEQMISSGLCDAGSFELYNAFQSEQVGSQGISFDANPGVNEDGLIGCLLDVTGNNGETLARVIWRFGVLLARDTKTHRAYPWLPLAPSAEVSAVSAQSGANANG